MKLLIVEDMASSGQRVAMKLSTRKWCLRIRGKGRCNAIAAASVYKNHLLYGRTGQCLHRITDFPDQWGYQRRSTITKVTAYPYTGKAGFLDFMQNDPSMPSIMTGVFESHWEADFHSRTLQPDLSRPKILRSALWVWIPTREAPRDSYYAKRQKQAVHQCLGNHKRLSRVEEGWNGAHLERGDFAFLIFYLAKEEVQQVPEATTLMTPHTMKLTFNHRKWQTRAWTPDITIYRRTYVL